MMSLQGKHPEEGLLQTKDITSVDRIIGGVNTTRKVEFSDGSVGFHKPFTGLDDSCARDYGQDEPLQPLHEAAAWHLANKLGARFRKLVPPCVLREVNGEIGSLAKGVSGDQGARTKPRRATEDDAAFFDAVIGQQDRHPYNFFTDGQDVHLIDHGFTFANQGDRVNYSWFLARRNQRGSGKLKTHEAAALKKLLGSPNLHGLADVLTAERSEALRRRAETMLATGHLPTVGDY